MLVFLLCVSVVYLVIEWVMYGVVLLVCGELCFECFVVLLVVLGCCVC